MVCKGMQYELDKFYEYDGDIELHKAGYHYHEKFGPKSGNPHKHWAYQQLRCEVCVYLFTELVCISCLSFVSNFSIKSKTADIFQPAVCKYSYLFF